MAGSGQAPGTYPAHWEADVLLADGQPAQLRPLRPTDEGALLELWDRLSPQSQYYRFFSPHRRLTDEDKQRFLHADQHDRVVLGVFLSKNLIAIGEFTRTEPTVADLAFVVEDPFHGHGIGGLLLEHLAQIARELGITQLTADVLAENQKMLTSLRAAGYALRASISEGVLHFDFLVEPTKDSQAVMAAREHRAEANSMRRVFEARSVAIVGGSARPASTGRRLLRNVIAGEFRGRLYVVNPGIDSAFGMPAYASLRDIPDPVDLAVIAVPAAQVSAVIEDCAAKDVHAVIVVSIGFAEAGAEGRVRQAELVAQCRAARIRLIGPCALGVVNAVCNSMNASMCDVQPKPGRIGFFCQSGPLSLTSLRALVDRGLGVSSFVSAGNRADVSGNDLLQYWEQDERTDVILCYLESLGNVHKFSRLARRVSTKKPVVAMTAGSGSLAPPLISHPVGRAPSPTVVNAMFRQAGVIRVDYVEHLFDVAQLLTMQPLPRGSRVAVVGDSPELTVITSDLATKAGFETRATWLGLAALSVEAYEEALRLALEDDEIDAVIAVFVPAPADTQVQLDVVRAGIAAVGNLRRKPLLAVIPGGECTPGLPAASPSATPEEATQAESTGNVVPIYRSPERAVLALQKTWGYARWRTEAETTVPILHDVDPDEADSLLDPILEGAPEEGRELTDDELTALLGCYGLMVLPFRRVSDLDTAVETAEQLGWNAVLKATSASVDDPSARRVWSHIRDANEMGVAWRQLVESLGDPAGLGVVVQQGASPGRRLTISAWQDRRLGPVVSLRIADVTARVINDVTYRLPPLTRADVSAMINELQLAPLLLGTGDLPQVDLAGLESAIERVAALTQNHPELNRLAVDVLADPREIAVVGALAFVQQAEPRYDLYARRLSAPRDSL